MKTDKELVAEWRRLVELAEAGIDKQPPEGAVRVQIAVAYGDRDDVVAFPCDTWGALEPPSSALRTAWRCVDRPTHAAIVHAWIPPLPEPAAAEGSI